MKDKKQWLYIGLAVLVFLQWQGSINVPILSDLVSAVKGAF